VTAGRDDPDAGAADLWDAPTEPELTAPRWPPPDEDPFVTLGLMDDLI
jgi:hypothetical protein